MIRYFYQDGTGEGPEFKSTANCSVDWFFEETVPDMIQDGWKLLRWAEVSSNTETPKYTEF